MNYEPTTCCLTNTKGRAGVSRFALTYMSHLSSLVEELVDVVDLFLRQWPLPGHNTWCHVPSQSCGGYPYRLVGGSALLYGIHHGASIELRKTDCFSRRFRLEQQIVLSCRSSKHSRPLWTESNSPSSSPLELVRVSRGSFLPLVRNGTTHDISERLNISSAVPKAC